MCEWLVKTTVFLFVYTRSQNNCFHRVYKILRWIGSSDFNITFVVYKVARQLLIDLPVYMIYNKMQ